MSEQASCDPVRVGLSMVKATRLVWPRTVTGDGEGLVPRAGLVWLGEVADRSGLTAGFGQVLAAVPRRRHDRACAWRSLVVALADGAECLSDHDAQAGLAQPRLFGPVPSRSTAQRVAFAAPGESGEFGEAATSVYREPYRRGDRKILVEEDQWA